MSTAGTIWHNGEFVAWEDAKVHMLTHALALADEVFLVGTAAELVPVREIDDLPIGPPGQITRELQSAYEDVLHGRDARYADWLDVVPVASKA